MAIRFSCPSCQQPIEIDDAWGGSSVACPYCRKVITAPRENTWPSREIPVASPVQPGFAPPLPPPGYAGPASAGTAAAPQPATTTGSSATWGLVLAVASAILWGIGFLIWFSIVGRIVIEKTGLNASQAEKQKALIETMQKSLPVSTPATTALFVGAFCGIAALVLGIRSLVRGERHTGKAIAACVLGSLAVFCQVLMMLAMLSSHTLPQ